MFEPTPTWPNFTFGHPFMWIMVNNDQIWLPVNYTSDSELCSSPLNIYFSMWIPGNTKKQGLWCFRPPLWTLVLKDTWGQYWLCGKRRRKCCITNYIIQILQGNTFHMHERVGLTKTWMQIPNTTRMCLFAYQKQFLLLNITMVIRLYFVILKTCNLNKFTGLKITSPADGPFEKKSLMLS